jgi:hypothetical protein
MDGQHEYASWSRQILDSYMMFDRRLVDRDTDRREFVPDLTNPLVVAEGSLGAQSLVMSPFAQKGQFQL